jgi:hypothetical protein
MSRKFSEARRAAFLEAVAETGNQTIAAERAKVSRAWVQLQRSGDPAFRAGLAAAVAEARASLSNAPGRAPSTGGSLWDGTRAPPEGWGFLDGEELVVKGASGGGGRRVQVARARFRQWTPRSEDGFLAALAATCNVKAACAAVGLTPAGAYRHRGRWPAFARRWEEALDMGCAGLEAALLEAAGNPFSRAETPLPGEGDGDAPAPAIAPMDASQAFHLLYMHRHYVPRPGRLPGRPPTLATPEQLIASLERGLAKFARRAARRGRRGE